MGGAGNDMTIINKESHTVEWRDNERENWMGDGWVVVPPELEQAARESGGCCELAFDRSGALVGLTPTEKPPRPEPEPSQAERDRADIDFLLALAGVSE